MFDKGISAINARRMAALQKRNEKLSMDYAELKRNYDALTKELQACKSRLEDVERVRQEFLDGVERANQARRRFDEAYAELKVIKKGYTTEMNTLLRRIRLGV